MVIFGHFVFYFLDISCFHGMLCLCDEYDVQWLKNRIESYILNLKLQENVPRNYSGIILDIQGVSDADNEVLYRLYLASAFNMDKLKKKYSGHGFRCQYYELRKCDYFQSLDRRMKYGILKYYLMEEFSAGSEEWKAVSEDLDSIVIEYL